MWEWLQELDVLIIQQQDSPYPSNFLYHYQSLIAGILALLAAAVTAYLINKQIRQQQSINQEQRRRSHRVNVIRLPIALASLTKYQKDCDRILIRIFREVEDLTEYQVTIRAPAVPLEALNVVAEVAGTAELRDARKLATILRTSQFISSRFEGLVSELEEPIESRQVVQTEDNLFGYIGDNILLQKLLVRCFPYARGEEANIEYKPSLEIDQLYINYRYSISEGRVVRLKEFLRHYLNGELEYYDNRFELD